MADKRNPMRAERIDGLARQLIINALNPAMTAATQWFERTLDDSANRRIAIPEAFLAADAIALLYDNIVGGLVVHEKEIARHVRRELPLIVTENLMMQGVRRGGDRQLLHEQVRHHSAAKRTNRTRKTALRHLVSDPMWALVETNVGSPEDYTGLSQQQTEEFLLKQIDPILEKEQNNIGTEVGEVRV